MAKARVFTVEGTEIKIMSSQKEDYISITDIIRRFQKRTDLVIQTWMRNMSTIEYLGLWEELHNPDFNPYGFAGIKERTGSNAFYISISQWIKETNAIGLITKAGRYGGTFAHKDIAIQFCFWLSPTFQLYLIKEFQRLKEEEAEQKNLEWDVKRIMAKAAYPIQTEAIREHLIPVLLKRTKKEGIYFASEADLLNLALFGLTAKEWRLQNPELKGNMRDHATHEQLLVMSLLQGLNAKLIEWGSDKEQRLELLNKAAIDWMNIVVDQGMLGKLVDKEKLLGSK